MYNHAESLYDIHEQSKSHKMTCFYEKYTRIVSLQFVNYGLCFACGLKTQWNLTTE